MNFVPVQVARIDGDRITVSQDVINLTVEADTRPLKPGGKLTLGVRQSRIAIGKHFEPPVFAGGSNF